MEIRLTRRAIESAVPSNGSLWLRDTEQRGLAVRVWRAGRGVRRAYVLSWPDGQGGTSTATLGHHGAPWKPDPDTGAPRLLTLELARQEAVRLLGARVDGRDPAAARKSTAGALTLRAFAPRYLEEWATVQKAPRTVGEERGNLDRHLLSQLGDERLAGIGAAHVSRLQSVLRAHPVTANRCRSLLSVMLNVAKKWGELPSAYVNPCALVPPFDESGRERPLTAEELPRVGKAMVEEEATAPVAVAAIRLLMFTGARPVEVLSLRRDVLPVAIATGVIVQESRKVGKKRRRRRPLYLNPLAIAALELAPAVAGNPFMFPGGVEERPLTISGLESAWKRIRRRAKVEDVRLYDAARHTFGTVAAMLATNIKYVQDLLGHSDQRTTEKYIHLGRGVLTAASEETSAAIAKALKGG